MSPVPGTVPGPACALGEHWLDELTKSTVKSELITTLCGVGGVTRIVPILQVRTLRLSEVFPFPFVPLTKFKFLLGAGKGFYM